jgi:hypothetical protein
MQFGRFASKKFAKPHTYETPDTHHEGNTMAWVRLGGREGVSEGGGRESLYDGNTLGWRVVRFFSKGVES